MVDAAFEVLQAEGDEACLALVRAHGGARGMVELVEGPLPADEAVAFAHGLAELGREIEAREILAAVCTAPGAWRRAQGNQIPSFVALLGQC
jgi:hypothetical protein